MGTIEVINELVACFGSDQGTSGEEIREKITPAVQQEVLEGRLPDQEECEALVLGIDEDGDAVIPPEVREKFPHITAALDSFF